MERQLSNVSFHSYQDYQPARRYGPQYEPGGYATAVQQRSNMTQREDALKFEQGRIKALQEERLHIQKKTFTKWMNSFLQKARMEVEDLFVDLADGRRLLKLLEIISGERLPRPNSGRMRVHKIENVNKSLSFLHTKVRLESIGAEDIVDGNPRLILGLIWTIILRFQIQEIEIDVDEENESSEKKSAKDALLLWCQRKTSGYHGVHIHNFTDCWRSGLGFNALIHSHRPDLFRWNEVPVTDHVETLNHAFDVAHENLGIPKLLDAEDVDTSRPDEKSVMTYVASYYHTFARMKNEQKSGRRIANIIGQLMDVDARKNEYSRLVSALLEWIRAQISSLGDRDFPNSLDGIQRLLLAFKQYRTVEKPPKYKERSEIEALFFSINTMHKSLVGEPWAPLEGQLPQDLERAWQKLEQAEHAREIALRTELLRQQRLEQLNYKFNTKSVLRKGYLKEMIQVLSDPRYGSNLAQVDATVKKHEAISADILARKERFEDLSAMAAELVREGYHGAEAVQRTSEEVLGRWAALLQLLERHRTALAALAALTALLREADARTNTVHEMKAQFHSEEVGRHLSDVERLLQAHALQELQLGALDEAIRGLVRRGAAAEGPEQPKKQLGHQLTQLEEHYDSLVAAAKDRKARLEDARNLYQFLEDHDEEEGWVTEKQRICRAEVAAKDLRGVHALRQKHTALAHELRARDHVAQRHRVKGQGLIDAKHPKSAEIERRLSTLNQQWATLRELCEAREKQLADAAEVYQFYGDANEADSWMKEKRVLLGSADRGGDAPSAQALLARHRALHEQLAAYKPELAGLRAAADRLQASGTIALQLPTEVETAPAAAEEEWGTETRLVPTEVWEEQPVERLEHRTVTEERSVPQVKALYAFSGQGISMAKGEVMFLISKSNPDWWSVRKPDRTDGFVPANYVREIEPRHVPVQVRRPEKVRTVQRVKKTVLVKQVVPARRPALQRRGSRTQAPHAPTVPERMSSIQDGYDELLKLSEERRLQLEDAIKLFRLFAECEDLERWMKDKERLLRAEDQDTVDNAKRKYEKFVTDLSAASKRLEHIEEATDELVKSGHGQAAAAVAAKQQLQAQWQRLLRLKQNKERSLEGASSGLAANQQLQAQWQRLLRLKQNKERSLEGASSVELFGRTCDEALDWMAEKEEQLRLAVTPAADLRTVRALQRRHAQLERELEPLREKVSTVTLLADSGTVTPAADLRTVRALQRRHAQLERELEPLREKVSTVTLLADSVKSQYPSEKANVEARQKQIQQVWSRCEEEAASRRTRLESAVGHQIFGRSSAQLHDWLLKTQEQLGQEVNAKDVATAEELHKQHQELLDDIKAHDDEFKEVIGLGQQLVGNNPALTDVADRIQQLKDQQKQVKDGWQAKEDQLQYCVELAAFNREADRIDATSGAHQAYLDYTDTGSSVDSAEALLRRHEELEARLAAHDERLAPFKQRAAQLARRPQADNAHITARQQQVLARRDAVRQAAAERRRALHASLAHHQFLSTAEELQTWIQDKTRTARDQSYRDLANLERKLQKHEAFERELQANEKQLRNIESVGQSLQKSDAARASAVGQRLEALQAGWAALLAASRDKGSKLRQAHAQRAHKRAIEDAKARLSELERALASEETGTDLRSCKRLLTRHQTLEQELATCEQKAASLAASGQDLVSGGHFDAPAIEQSSRALLQAARGLRDPAAKARGRLETTLELHKFATEVASELDWISGRRAAAEAAAPATDLHGAQLASKRHTKLRNELQGRRQHVEKVLQKGKELEEQEHPDSDKLASKRHTKLRNELQGRRQHVEKVLQKGKELEEQEHPILTRKTTDLHGAQLASKRHTKLRNELQGRRQHVEKVLQKGKELEEQEHPDSDKIKELSTQLEEAYSAACDEAEARGGRVEAELKAQQLLHEALEVDAWLADKAAALADPDTGRDLHRATALLTRHKAVELELDTYSAIIAEMGRAAGSMAAAGRPEPQERLRTLGETLERLQRLAQARQKALVNSVCRHEYLAESAELESWIQEQLAAASSEDYGQDYEHLLILRSKFEELRHRVETGAERFNQCEELAKKLLASESPHIDEIERRQAAVGESWQRLVDQIAARASRLHAAGDIHRFHRDVSELLARAADATARTQHGSYRDALAQHAAIDAQVQVLQEEGERLIKLYPGGNVQQIELQQRALEAAWRALHQAAARRKEQQQQHEQLQHALTQIRDLSSWSAGVRAGMQREARVRDAAAAQALRADHDALKAEIEARDDSFQQALQLAHDMVQSEHPAAQEVEEKSEALLAERAALHAAWAARQVALDQLIDLHCFLRDAQQLQDLCAAQEPVLGSEISPTLSVEEVDKLLKKHEAFEKLLVTQDEKLSTLNTHGDKLLQQNHVESQRIADELRNVNERRKKIHELSAKRRSALRHALTRAQFARDVSEARAWLQGKLQALNSQQQGEVTSLEDKIKKLQKHQAFTAELAANEPRLREVEELAARLQHEPQHDLALQQLRKDWRQLLQAAEQRGRGLEEAQDILEFEQQLDKIEAWIRDKEMMVQAHELGRDYEHCSALLRKLDDLDSDMKVDDKRVKSICQLADKLLADKTQGPNSHLATVAARRDALLHKWHALSGALKKYRERLAAALDIHAFHRDVQDTQERIDKKAALFGSHARGRSLAGAHELRRRHDALVAEARAVKDKIKALVIEGHRLAKNHPESAEEIEAALQQLRTNGEELEKLAAARSALLDEAIAGHKFDESLKELELWVSETVKRLQGAEPAASVAEAEAALQLHRERKAEIDGRQKSIAALQRQAEEQQLPELQDKLARLHQLSATLDRAWKEREGDLTQAHQLEILNEQAQQVEDWLATKEAFLNNDDLGDNLEAVEALQAKHDEFAKLLSTQGGKVGELKARAPQVQHAQAHKRVADLLARADKLQESCSLRAAMLEQSKQLQQFLEDLRHERDWIQIKMQLACEQNYRELSNLQSKIQKHAAFEAELAANKGRIDAVANTGEALIESKHYASREIATLVEELEAQWAELQAAAQLRRERLQEAYQARVYLRGLDDFTAWLLETESQLLSEELGSDLALTEALLKRHARLEQQAAGKADTATQLADTARQLADNKHFMAEEMLEKAEQAVNRYKQLAEPMQIRRDNLQDAAQLRRWERDAEEEARWLAEREPALSSTECGETLQEAQKLHKKHLALEAELVAREPAITSLCQRGAELARRGHFAAASLESRSRNLSAAVKRAMALAVTRTRRLQRAIDTLQLVSEISDSLSWARERRDALLEADTGRDEESVLLLQRRLAARRREIAQLDASLPSLERAAAALPHSQEGPTPEDELVSTKLAELKGLHEEMKLLSARREQRLQQSLNYFKFAQECAEAQEWIGEQMSVAASEEYGLDVEHVETLQQAFDNFLQQLQANEGRIEAVCEAGQALLEENTPEQERVRQKMDDVRGLWEDLRELALARQEALAGARQVHEFDRSADEAAAWIEQKEQALGGGAPAGALLPARRRALQALRDDLGALRDRHTQLQQQAESLGQAFPDAREHVTCKLEQVTEALEALTTRADDCEQQLQLAQQLEAFFGTCQGLLAWTNETIARVTAPELAGDVAGAERLVARHQDICAEIQARDDAFNQLYAAADKLVSEGHFMSAEISARLSALRARRSVLDAAAARRRSLYAQHLDALVFKRDADALDHWIQTRVPLVRDGKLGDSVSQVEELINRHRDLEETIEAQRERFDALRRLTLVEQAFKEQQAAEAAARAQAAERAAKERAELTKRREVQRLQEQRRRTHAEHATSEDTIAEPALEPPSPGAPSSPPQTLPSAVKRAESMQVTTKAPKRTPSFTTRRRTQSFRRHRRPDGAELPPLEIEGFLERKQVAGNGGARATVRSWRGYHSVLCGQLLCFFRDEQDFANSKAAAPPVAIANARCSIASDYTKRAHVFRLSLADGAEYLFAASSRELMQEWVAKLSFHAALPPQLQLTPYSPGSTGSTGSGQEPVAELRRRLQENASSSSDEESPAPARKPRSQAEILHEHRAQPSNLAPSSNAHRGSVASTGTVESTVLPSLPPRQPENREDENDVIMRNSGQPNWGRSRFSNGRDINAEFIRSQQATAVAPPLPSSGPPAIPERGPNLPERGPNLPERGPNLPERGPNIPEDKDKQSVTALVNSYQQRMTRSSDNNNASRTTGWQAMERQNNNWQESTTQFYTSDGAYGGNAAGSARPASVAGGSPALDQRPASRSSGESELSLGGNTREKKDKKGVFGGLFSRKKRPQSHM